MPMTKVDELRSMPALPRGQAERSSVRQRSEAETTEHHACKRIPRVCDACQRRAVTTTNSGHTVPRVGDTNTRKDQVTPLASSKKVGSEAIVHHSA